MHYSDEIGGGLLLTGFMIGAASFGVDARLVQEVVKVGDLTCVHDAPPGVVGIRNLRGRIVTVVDMAVHLNLGSVNTELDNRLLIMEQRGDSIGFLVDCVTDAINLDESQIGVPPASLDPQLRSRLRGVWRDGDAVTSILDPEALFECEESETSVAKD